MIENTSKLLKELNLWVVQQPLPRPFGSITNFSQNVKALKVGAIDKKAGIASNNDIEKNSGLGDSQSTVIGDETFTDSVVFTDKTPGSSSSKSTATFVSV